MIARFDRFRSLDVRKDALDAPETAARENRGRAARLDGRIECGGGQPDDALRLGGRAAREGHRCHQRGEPGAPDHSGSAMSCVLSTTSRVPIAKPASMVGSQSERSRASMAVSFGHGLIFGDDAVPVTPNRWRAPAAVAVMRVTFSRAG